MARDPDRKQAPVFHDHIAVRIGQMIRLEIGGNSRYGEFNIRTKRKE